MTNNQISCKLQEDEPREPNWPAVISPDFKAIANFDGYLIYNNYNDSKGFVKRYMPLKLISLESVKDGDLRILILYCTCATIKMTVEKLEQDN